MLTVDLIENFIKGLSLTSFVTSISNDGTDTTLTVENVYHTRFNMIIDVDSVDYTVVSVDHDLKQIVVSGVIPSAVAITVPNPFYFHGTPYATNAHISYLDDASKVPMVYLMEILRERILSPNSAIERESEIRLFFLDVANYADWSTDDHYSNVIVGLNNLLNEFITQIRDSSLFYMFETEFEVINHIKWGQFVDLKGHVQSIFNERLTGIELRFTLPIRKPC